MSNELRAFSSSGSVLYAVLLNGSGSVWNGSTFESLQSGNWGTYDVALTEVVAGIYFGDMPSVAAGNYNYVVYEQAGGSPAATDSLVGGGSLAWDGSAEILGLTQANVRTAVGLSSANLDTQLGNLPSASTNASAVRSELTTELGRVDVAVSTRLAVAGYTAPANSDITAIKAKTDNLPGDPADASDIAAAIAGLASTLTTIQGYVDDLETRLTSARAGYLDKLNVSGTLAHSDAAATYKADVSAVALEATAQALKVVLDKLATMLEQDGGVYRYNANALEQAPTGAGTEDLEAAVTALEVTVGELVTSCDALYDRINEDVPEGPINVIPSPETGLQTVAWCICYDQYGQPEEDVRVYVRVKSGGSSPAFYDSRVARGVSTESGLATVVIPRDAALVFEVKRESGGWVEFNGEAVEQLELPSAIGGP